MCFERFESNRAKYGQCSSWAVWNQGACEYLRFEPDAEAAPGFFLNTSVRKLNAICSQRDLDGLGWRLNPNVVLVALNFAERDERTKAATAGIDYHAFHEETSLTSDQRLRDACCGTGLWGGYLTDLVKFDGDELTPFRSSKADPIIHDSVIRHFGRCRWLVSSKSSTPWVPGHQWWWRWATRFSAP